jgi:GDP-mannose transporter
MPRTTTTTEEDASGWSVAVAIVGYSLCSSTLLLANKLALAHLPLPSVVSLVQIVSSTAIVVVLQLVGGAKVGPFSWVAFRAYGLYAVSFVFAIYTNMQALSEANVETIIVFRACSPIAVAVVEWFFMDRTLPSLRSTLSLLGIVAGAVAYCVYDSQFKLNGLAAYSWAVAYFFFIVIEMTYGKAVTSSVKMESVWGPVLWQNGLAALPMFCIGYAHGDYDGLGVKLAGLSPSGMLVIAFSCVAGTLIGYTGWLCRGMVSATTFTLVGVVNKFLTVLLNVAVWDKHSSPEGLAAVCACIVAGSFYQQAPRRDDKTAKKRS